MEEKLPGSSGPAMTTRGAKTDRQSTTPILVDGTRPSVTYQDRVSRWDSSLSRGCIFPAFWG